MAFHGINLARLVKDASNFALICLKNDSTDNDKPLTYPKRWLYCLYEAFHLAYETYLHIDCRRIPVDSLR